MEPKQLSSCADSKDIWPSDSLDLNPTDFAIRSVLENKPSRTSYNHLDSLKKFSKGKTNEDNRLCQMMAISGSSTILVSIPSIVMICISWNIANFNDIEISLVYAMPG
uniref:Neur_chan_memb domain-containing protein n=1 Tax=Heterorhabditis bacteriophora TaxID=37862 RepID=A0A1I7X5D2_HETBA